MRNHVQKSKIHSWERSYKNTSIEHWEIISYFILFWASIYVGK